MGLLSPNDSMQASSCMYCSGLSVCELTLATRSNKGSQTGMNI